MLRTGYITLTVVAFIIGGQGFAGKPAGKGKPESNKFNEGDLSFSDSETDMIKSDGLGPYRAAINTKTDTIVLIANKGRTVFFDFSNCVSGNCNTPFVADYKDITNIAIFNPLEMLPGESKTTSVRFTIPGPNKKHPGWNVFCLSFEDNPPVLTAYDTDDDGKIDQWVVEATVDTDCLLTTDYGGTPLGYYSLPFTLTFDLD